IATPFRQQSPGNVPGFFVDGYSMRQSRMRVSSGSPLVALNGQSSFARVCPLSGVVATGRRNTGGQLAINNDDGLPNARQVAFGDSPRNQLSHNTIFSATPIPLRSH